jgi:hypothetical protein
MTVNFFVLNAQKVGGLRRLCKFFIAVYSNSFVVKFETMFLLNLTVLILFTITGVSASTMKTQLLYAFLLFLLKHKVTYATMWTKTYTELDVYLEGFTLESSKVDTVFACYTKCEDNILCTSINMNLNNMTCELKYSTKAQHPKNITSRQNVVYMEVRDYIDAPGAIPDKPVSSCKWWKGIDNQAKSGVYWIKFNEPLSKAFQVFCEMTIDGGGWTLVYSYRFTQFNSFKSGSNAVTPIPNWPGNWSPVGWVPQSTITPLSESSYSAMDFSLWKKIGNQILFKPSITNWIACLEGTGSLVHWKTGTVACRVVKAVTSICTTVVPTKIGFYSFGPGLTIGDSVSRFYLGLVGKTSSNWPTHDPCGTNNANHLTNVPNPGGALYIR